MSLLDSYAYSCKFVEKTRVADGAGGYITTYALGAGFTAHITLESSGETYDAEQQKLQRVFSVLVAQNVPLVYGDIFKTGDLYYRVTSDPSDRKTPAGSALSLKYCSAERWEKP